MRTSLFLLLPVSLLALSGLGACANSVEDCERNPTLECFLTAGGGNGTGAQNTGGGTGNGGAGGNAGGNVGGSGLGGDNTGGSVPSNCDPTVMPIDVGSDLPADCDGVFVMGGATGDGSRANPTGDLAAALASATMTKPIYVCSAATVTATVSISSDVKIFGGFDCTWKRNGERSPIDGATAGLPVFAITGGNTDVTLADLAIAAPNGVAPGDSSLGVVVDAASLELLSTSVTSGSGSNGANAIPVAMAAQSGAPGGNGGPGCMSTNPPGGTPGELMCNGFATDGGQGGPGSVTATGFAGQPGVGGAQGGAGQIQNNTAAGAGQPGGSGSEGSAASQGPTVGAFGGVLYDPPFPPLGQPGTSGGGGGGGGGASECSTNGALAGPGGGGGGSGGCGGSPGTGGQGGGASFALVGLNNAKLLLVASELFAGSGGQGGDGADGQPGGAGGTFGSPGAAGGTAIAKAGGDGGQGGRGGPGAGGAGGPAAAIVVDEATPAPAHADSNLQTPGAPGAGGAGATNANVGNDGAAGQQGLECLVLQLQMSGAGGFCL